MNQKKGHKNKKKTIAMLLVMAIFISILPDSFTASAAEIIKEATETTPALAMQFQINSAWGGSIAADIILTNKGSKTIENWEITYNWKPVITSLWCAQYQAEEKAGQEGAAGTNRYTIHPYEYNNTIHPGSEIRIGLIASGEEAELAEPDSYEIKINGENWVYDTKKGGLKKAEETEEPTKEPEHSEVPEITTTPEATEEPTTAPEITKEPEVTEAPEKTEIPTEKPEITANPEITATPEETEKLTIAPEITKAPEISTEPEPTASPEITEKPTEEPAFTKEPEHTPAPTATPEPTKEPDYNLEDHEFTDDLIITSDKTLTKNISCKNLYIKSGTLNTDGYQLTVRENAEQSGGRLTIEKESKVTIKGKTTLTAGILSLDGSTLQTEGNLTITGTGELQLHSEKAHAQIGGDCRLESRQYFDKGLLEIKGSLSIPDKNWLKNANKVKLKLSGNTIQSVTTEEGTSLHSIDLTESAGVEFHQAICATSLTGIENITGKKATFAVGDISLTKDTELNYDVEIISGKWQLGEHNLTIKGNTKLSGGSLRPDNGTVTIQGDLHAAGGELHLWEENSHAIIDGSCLIESAQSFNRGILEIKGNLSIPDKNWLSYTGKVNLKLSGTNIQSVTTEEGTNLHSLDLTESAGVEFHQAIHATTLAGLENITGEKATFAVKDISLAKGTVLNYDVEIISGKWQLGEHNLIIAGNVKLSGGSLRPDNGTVRIQGNLHAAGGELYLWEKKSHAEIDGSCLIESGQYLNDGTIEIKGDLNISGQNWLRYANKGKLKLSGKTTQSVTAEEGTSLHNLDLTESAGVKFYQTIQAKNLTGIENITGKKATFAVGDISLTKDTELNYDVEIISGKWQSGEHNLTIRGDLELRDGKLGIGDGQAEIKGDCSVTENGQIQLHHYNSHLTIKGDCLFGTRQHIADGILELKSNLTIEESSWLSYAGKVNLKLSGSQKQKVITEEGAYLYNLDITESKGVTFKNTVNARTLYGIEKLTGRENTLNVSRATPSKDGTIQGDITVEGGSFDLDGKNLTIDGILTIKAGAVSINQTNANLTIEEDLEMKGGSLAITGGSATIKNSSQIGGTAAITMQDEKSSLHIAGDLTSSSTAASKTEKGSIYVQGDIRQTPKAAADSLNIGGTLYLCGKEKQHVRLAHQEKSIIQNLNLQNATNVEFHTGIHARKIRGWEHIGGSSFALCGYTGKLEEDAIYRGYLLLFNSIIDISDHTLNVENLEQYDTLLTVHNGTLCSWGNYALYGESTLFMNNEAGTVQVHGTFEMASQKGHKGLLEAGTIQLWENLIQKGHGESFAIGKKLMLHFMKKPDPETGDTRQIVLQMDAENSPIPFLQRKSLYGADIIITKDQKEVVSPATLYYSFLDGVADGLEEIPNHLLGDIAAVTVFQAIHILSEEFGIAAAATAEAVISKAVIAVIIGIAVGGGIDLLLRPHHANQDMYKLGKFAAEAMVIILIGAIEAGITAFISAKGGFQAFAEYAGPAIKKLQAGGETAINELTAAYRSAEGILKSIKNYITEEAAKALDDMAAKGLADETALKNAYGYLIEQASKGTEYAKLTARELKLLLNQAGEASEKNLKNMLEWAKTMPEHFDRLGSDSLKYLKERWAKYQKSGTAEKIEQGLKEAAEKLPEGEELGLDGVKAVIEKCSGTIWTGKDKYVPELANAIEQKFPGRIQAVEKLVYGKDGAVITDLDIELENIVIQVKSGSAKGLTSQMIRTADATGKIVISYTPDISQSSAVLRGIREKGFDTFTTIEELLDYLATH